MGKTAAVFPGQGSQYVGMGKDWYEADGAARYLFDQADTMLGFKLSQVCFYGPEEELRQTRNTQPAIFLHSLVITRALKNMRPDMVAGHSLGAAGVSTVMVRVAGVGSAMFRSSVTVKATVKVPPMSNFTEPGSS